MSTELATVGPPAFSLPDLQVMAKQVAASRLFGGCDTEQAVFTLMLLCQAEGLHPIQAMRRYHIIEGRPSMRADAMQAEFQRHGGVIRWEQSDDEICVAWFIHPIHAPNPGFMISLTLQGLIDRGVALSWDKEKKNYVIKKVYRQFPAQMLRARIISEGVRMVLPGVVVGIYTPEEIEASNVLDVTPVEPSRAAIVSPVVESFPVELPTSRAAINSAFSPGQAATPDARAEANAARSIESTGFLGDKIGAKGLDRRRWDQLLSEAVSTANAALAGYQANLLSPHEATRHMVKAAVGAGAEDPEPVDTATGKPKRVGIGKLNLFLAELYADQKWREWLRKNLAGYIERYVTDAAEARDTEVEGDPEPTPAEEISQEVQPVAAGLENEGWTEDRQ
jgi:hypothetical protein